MIIERLLNAVPALRDIPVGALIAVLVLLPLFSGALLFTFRTRLMRRVVVCVTAWAMTAAAFFLFMLGAAHKEILEYNPPAIAGIHWGSLITIADFALLLAFVAIGIARRSILISLLAFAQLLPLAWFEWTHHKLIEVEPALTADWLTITMVLIVSIIGTTVAVYALPYMRDHEEHLHLEKSRRHIFLMIIMVFLGAMNGLVLSNNLLWLYFFWEVTTLCSFFTDWTR